jgi:hypothetical protein
LEDVMKIERLHERTSPYKTLFREKYRLTTASISRATGISYPHLTNVLNGTSRLSPQIEARFKKLMDLLEAGGVGDGNRP